MKRLNRCLIRREQYGLTVKDAIKLENKRIEQRNVEKYLAKCMNRMFGDVSPVQRNTGYPFIWHN